MQTILLLIHSEPGGSLSRPAFEAVSAARMLLGAFAGSPLVVGVIGADAQQAATRVTGCGARRVLAVSAAAFTQPRYSSDVLAAAAIGKAIKPSLVLVPASSRWNRVAGGVAHRLGGVLDTHVTGLSVEDGAPIAARWYYRQRMEAAFTRSARPWLLAIESGAFPAWSGGEGPVSVEEFEVGEPVAPFATDIVGTQSPPVEQQTIRPDAELLFVTGAGWTKKQPDGQVKLKEAEALILEFLRASRASLGSSKSLVDLGGEGQSVLPFLTHLNQIGQTGSTPRHAKGLSTCCHGEEPHTVGWRFINERRAISLDPNCGWARGKADVLYVADAFAVMSQVNRLLAG